MCVTVKPFQSSSDESGDSTLSGLACVCMLAHSGGWCVPCSVEQWCEGCACSMLRPASAAHQARLHVVEALLSRHDHRLSVEEMQWVAR